MPKSAPIPSVFRASNISQSQDHRTRQQTRPLTLSELADRASSAASKLPFSNSVPINRYILGADSLRQQANAYQKEKRNEDQFICLVKCARLLVELLPTHRQWQETNEETRKKVRKEGQDALNSLSALKSAQHDLFESWRAKNPNVSLDEVPPSSSFGENHDSTSSKSSSSKQESQEASVSRTEFTHEIRNQKEPSVQTLLGRSSRDDHQSQTTATSSNDDATPRNGGIDYQKPDRGDALFGFDVRSILGFGSKPSPASTPAYEIPYNYNRNRTYDFDSISSLTSQMATLGASKDSIRYPTLNPSLSIRMSKHQEAQGFAPSSNHTAKYYQTMSSVRNSGENRYENRKFISDSIPTSSHQMPTAQHYDASNSSNSGSTPYTQDSHNPNLMPVPLHRESASSLHSSYSSPYPLPPGIKNPTSTITAPKPQSGPSRTSTSSHQNPIGLGGNVSSQASRLAEQLSTSISQDLPTARTESGAPLRPLLIPSELIERFMDLARKNTEANKETCGLLMGKLKNNVLTVTHLLLPQQTSDADSCTTHSEEDIFLFQEENSVSVFSWIHTHPSQSCFLSSLDLHTHASYQSMLPEAIAIVVSPKSDPNLGLFRLTDKFGLEMILKCKNPASFHPHTDENGRTLPLYTDAIFGHVRLLSGDQLEGLRVTDLRR